VTGIGIVGRESRRGGGEVTGVTARSGYVCGTGDDAPALVPINRTRNGDGEVIVVGLGEVVTPVVVGEESEAPNCPNPTSMTTSFLLP
jgi:hypothetical protein